MHAKHLTPSRRSIDAASVRTTLMELLEALGDLTKDDTLVMAAVNHIFDSYSVRLADSLVPLRLVSREVQIEAAIGYKRARRRYFA